MKKHKALKIVLLVLVVLVGAALVAGYFVGRSQLASAPTMIQQKLKEQGIAFKYKTAQLVPVGVGLVFDGVTVDGAVLPYEVSAKEAKLGLGFGFSLPPLRLTFSLIEPNVTTNEQYNANAKKAAKPATPSEPPPKALGWALALVQIRFEMKKGNAEPFGVSGIDAMVSLAKLGVGAKGLERIEIDQQVSVQKVKAIDEKLGWSPGVSSHGRIAYLGDKVAAEKLDLGVGPLITRVNGSYTLATQAWVADVSVPSTNLKEASSFLTGPAKDWIKGMSGQLGLTAKASGTGPDAQTVKAQGEIHGKKIVVQFANPRLGGEARIDTDLSFNKAETVAVNGNVNVDLTETELKQDDLFVKKDGVPASMAVTLKTAGDKLQIEQGSFKFHNLQVEAAGNVTTNDNPTGNINVKIAPTSLAGWEKFFPKYSSLKTAGTIEGKLDYAGPLKEWQQAALSMDLKAKDIVLPLIRSLVGSKDLDVGGIVRLNSVTQAAISRGAIQTLNTETEIDMKDNHLAYGNAFEKKEGVPMSATFSVASAGNRATIKRGSFQMGSLKAGVSGAIENLSKPKANLVFSAEPTKLADLMALSPLAKNNMVTSVSGAISLKGGVTGFLLEKTSPPQVKGDLLLNKVALDYNMTSPKKTVRLKNLSGPVAFTNTSITLRKVAASFPQTDMVLDMTVQSFDKPNINFQLNASRFTMADFYDTQGKSVGVAPIPVSNAGAEKGAKTKEEDFRKNPYVRNTRLHGTVSMRNADLGQTKAESLTAKVSYENLELKIDPVVMKVWGGTITSNTQWDGRPASPVAKFAMKSAAVDANLFVGSWSEKAKDILTGKLDTDFNVQFTGMTPDEIKKSTKGGGSFALNDGEIKTMKFSEKPLEAIKKIPALSANIQKTSWQEKLNQIAGTFTIQDGKIKLNNPNIKSNQFDLTASEADLDFDMNINAKVTWLPKESLIAANTLDLLRDDSGRPSVPLAISGPVKSPNITVDMNGVEQRAKLYLQRKLEAEVKNKVQKELEDKLKGGLQNLFK